MSKSENIALYKYLTRPASPQLPATSGERQMFKRGSTIESQLPVEDYVTIVREMVADSNYRPPVNLNAKEVGRIPNFEKAKEIVKEEMGDGFTQAYQRNLNRGRKVRAKEKRKVDPELKARYSASRAETRRAGRIKKLGGDVKMTPDEKFLNFQQSLVTRQLNEKIRQNPDLILKNQELMDQLSTTVDKDGNIVKVKPTLNDIKNRGIFEIEHQRDIYKKGKMKDFPYNRNLILGPYNRTGGFKEMAEKFIEKFPDPNNPKVQSILNKADELGVTIRPNVPEGTFPTKALGYKQTGDPVRKFIDVATKVTPALARNDLGIPSYKGDIEMAKRALGVKQLKSEFFPAARSTGEFISETASDLLTKGSRLKGLGKLAGVAGVGYGIYDTGVAFQEGKSVPEMAFRFVGVDPIYNAIKEYSRLPKEMQAIQKQLNAQMSFDATKDDPLAEGMMQRPEVSEEDKLKLEVAKQEVREKIQAENQARAEGRMGALNFFKEKIFQATGQPYSVAFANGGRVHLADGGDPKDIGRRKFIKFGVALASIPFLGKYVKPITKAAPQVVEAVSRSADSVPTYLMDLISKVKMMGSSKVIGKADNPNGFVQYDLGDYTVTDGAEFTRIKKQNQRGEFIDSEVEMEIQKDPETGAVLYEEATATPDIDGKLKDVDFGIDDDIHEMMRKFTYEK